MKPLHAFKKLLYLQALLGIIAYAIAEKNPAIALTVPTLALLSWYVVEAQGGKPLPRWIINTVAILFCGWLVVSLVNAAFLPIYGIGRFLLFLQLAKLYEKKSNRDLSQIILLSLMQVISAAMISIDFHFGIFVAFYLIIALITALQFQFKLARDQVHQANLKAAPNPQLLTPQPLITSAHARKQFTLLTATCAILAIAFSSLLFITIPRGIGKGMLGGFQLQSSQSEIGFTDEVDLDDDSLISTNDQPMLNLQVFKNGQNIGSPARPYLLRGNALDSYASNFSKNAWRRSNSLSPSSRNYILNPNKITQFTKMPPYANAIEQRITLMGDTKRILFSAGPPVAFQSDNLEQITFSTIDQVLVTNKRFEGSFKYTVYASQQPIISPQNTYRPYTGIRRLINFNTYARQPVFQSTPPDISPIENLTRQLLDQQNITRDKTRDSSPKDIQIANIIRNFLQREFIYTLDPPTIPKGVEPIEFFLLTSRTGHCEYFASAMTAMLRSVGIRARLISGFRAQEYNAIGQYYVVRQSHAHAWIEVWTPEQSWQTYDPSPFASDQSEQLADVGLLGSIRDLYEFVEFSWLNTFIAYDENQQDSITTTTRDFFDTATTFIQQIVQDISSQGFASIRQYLPKRWKLIAAIIAAPIVLLLLFLWYRDTRKHITLNKKTKRTKKPRFKKQKRPKELKFYTKTLKLLDKAGFTKPPWQPPAAFAQQLANQHPDRFNDLTHLTQIFYQLRFGQQTLDPQKQRDIKQHLTNLRKSI